MLPKHSWLCCFPLPEATLVKKMNFPSPSSYQLPAAPWLWVELHAELPLPCRELFWLQLAQVLSIPYNTHTYTCSVVSKTLSSCGHCCLWLLRSFHSFFPQWSTGFVGSGCLTDVPFMDEHPTVKVSSFGIVGQQGSVDTHKHDRLLPIFSWLPSILFPKTPYTWII